MTFHGAVREEAFFGSCFLFVPAGSADEAVEAVLGDGVEEGDSLETVSAGERSGLLHHSTLVDRFLDGADKEFGFDLLGKPVSEVESFLKIVAGIDVDEGKRDAGGGERLLGEPGHQNGVFASGKE